jgi:hypothetical protein
MKKYVHYICCKIQKCILNPMDGKFSDLYVYATFKDSDPAAIKYIQRPTTNAVNSNKQRVFGETYKTHNTIRGKIKTVISTHCASKI